ncbi:MAG TPA: diguanylate cyclase [Methylomirabilota bacterium]|nr:diguanylate cyclase [Methylomirabilota bacterium]
MMSDTRATESAPQPARVLVIANSQTDFELLVRTLQAARLKVDGRLASVREQCEGALREGEFDVVLAENHAGGWGGMDAVAVVHAVRPGLPVILITEPLGEERAVLCMRSGLADYVWNTRLYTLADAVRRVIENRRSASAGPAPNDTAAEAERRFQLLADSIASAVFIYRGTQCCYTNRAAQTITGYSEEELRALNSWDLVHPDSRASVIEHGMARFRDGDAATRYELKIVTKDGHVRWLDVTTGRIDFDGQPAGLLTGLDITARKLMETSEQHQSSRDPLTGLLSVSQMRAIFQSEAKRSERTGRSFSVVLLKLQGLKHIHERWGFPAGGRALCKLSFVVGAVCRSGDAACRFADDEFLLLLPETSSAGARHLAARIGQRLNAEESDPPFSVSMGLAVFPQQGPTLEHLARAAGLNFRTLNRPAEKEIASTA